jgi:hypothetical protein
VGVSLGVGESVLVKVSVGVLVGNVPLNVGVFEGVNVRLLVGVRVIVGVREWVGVRVMDGV